MVQVALVLDEHSTRSPLIDYAAWWQEHEAAEYLCWVRSDGVLEPPPLVLEASRAGVHVSLENRGRMLDLRLRNVTYFQESFNPEIVDSLGQYVDLIGLCRKQFNLLRQAIDAGRAVAPACPVFVPSGFPPPTSVLVQLDMDTVQAVACLQNLFIQNHPIVLLAFGDDPPAKQKRIVQFAQSHFEQVGLTHAGSELATLAHNFLPNDALLVASLRCSGSSRRLIRKLLALPIANKISFLLIL
jgi:hypothetical protein